MAIALITVSRVFFGIMSVGLLISFGLYFANDTQSGKDKNSNNVAKYVSYVTRAIGILAILASFGFAWRLKDIFGKGVAAIFSACWAVGILTTIALAFSDLSMQTSLESADTTLLSAIKYMTIVSSAGLFAAYFFSIICVSSSN
ncbi:hypothetical protein BX070DRAFT_221801 [Coemansia spiralis]|nr:hypothetical protein BX070DRAFT_221801 [Coemansia spiralis]